MKIKIHTLQKNKKARNIIIVILCLCVLSLSYVYVAHLREVSVNTNNQSAEGNLPPYEVPALTKKYSNSVYSFSLSMPENFSTREFNMGEQHTIVLEDSKNNGIQVVITPYDQKRIKNLTKDMIQSAIPDMKISDEQPLEIGRDNTGLAFKSDNETFGGDSREVWFIYKDNLYQISTYSRLDNLLKGIFGTWEFK